ncbi:carbohydrate binding domain-containing protein [Arthrobacter sp. ISL-72]|uniref:carbohydrate binding domain-containing protein n=1 Tax=Arthrobacter sp. ISL-72 TaxID=2819114 RepID=UPI0037BF0923
MVSVEPNTTYVLSGWVRSGVSGEPTSIGVKNHGGPESSATSSTTDWVFQTVQFTTGATSTTAQIYVYKGAGGDYGYGDDIQVRRSSTITVDSKNQASAHGMPGTQPRFPRRRLIVEGN